ncbi:[weak similarity to] plasmid replication protein RepA [methanotrophic bacterial endosymbiont of Bathymodiolus sp.]|nr:[weak similarity to] plasmid replication protein RepA [methanotrophic bacterial endosymbiont of Bathymodiolus sp.]
MKGQNGEPLAYRIEIQPALIKQLDGEYIAFFPTKAEEIIEEVLKKIFTEQNLGIHDSKNAESWVKFSYGMINKELRKNKCSRTHQQIKHSLEIISKCILTVYEDREEIYTGAILQDYCSVDRKQYLDDTKALHIARLSVFISHAVNTLQYRQFNLRRLTTCKEQLSRWLLKRLINRFHYASLTTTHLFFYFLTIKAESSLLRLAREIDNRIKVTTALEELKSTGTIFNYDTLEIKEGRKIVDIKYTITATHEFSSEQKAANARKNMIEEKALKKGLQIVDKSKSK